MCSGVPKSTLLHPVPPLVPCAGSYVGEVQETLPKEDTASCPAGTKKKREAGNPASCPNQRTVSVHTRTAATSLEPAAVPSRTDANKKKGKGAGSWMLFRLGFKRWQSSTAAREERKQTRSYEADSVQDASHHMRSCTLRVTDALILPWITMLNHLHRSFGTGTRVPLSHSLDRPSLQTFTKHCDRYESAAAHRPLAAYPAKGFSSRRRRAENCSMM